MSNTDLILANIAQVVLDNLDCASKQQLTASQAVNINCDTPDEWSEIYNSATCVAAREANRKCKASGRTDCPSICSQCYACCAGDINQKLIMTFTANCGVTPGIINTIRKNTIALLTKMPYGTELTDAQMAMLNDAINKVIANITEEGVTKSIQQIYALQNITMLGAGSQRHITQTAAVTVMATTLHTSAFAAAIDNYSAVLATILANPQEGTMSPPGNPNDLGAAATGSPDIDAGELIYKYWYIFAFALLIILILLGKIAYNYIQQDVPSSDLGGR